ncbi:response regulator transcription factor [Kribbella sp. NPDC051952]|uniref:response regulator n=1 Tax=Kribbella sp. NPDC051952 TaxID=3154851 RepID=UPI0034296690
MGAARILIVDDYVLFRSSARRMLESHGFDVIGESGDGSSAISAVQALRPDVVLLDVQLPDIDGFEVARRLAEEPDAPAVILTSIRDASAYRSRLPGTPALGFISKAELSETRISELLGCGG